MSQPLGSSISRAGEVAALSNLTQSRPSNAWFPFQICEKLCQIWHRFTLTNFIDERDLCNTGFSPLAKCDAGRLATKSIHKPAELAPNATAGSAAAEPLAVAATATATAVAVAPARSAVSDEDDTEDLSLVPQRENDICERSSKSRVLPPRLHRPSEFDDDRRLMYRNTEMKFASMVAMTRSGRVKHVLVAHPPNY